MKTTVKKSTNYLTANVLLIIFVLQLASCATNSGIVPVDNGGYYISISSPQVSFGPPIKQKAEAYETATEFCTDKKQTLKTVNLKEINQVFGRHASVELTFQCVPK